MDTSLQSYSEYSLKTDIRLLKVIHDLKNPVIACRQTVNDKEITDLEKVREIANQELEDLEDMLENLRTEFKARQLMDLNEQHRMVSTQELILSLKSSHTRLAKNGNNSLLLETSEGFPENLKLQKLNTKRIINNLISNSLKHTSFGKVSITFSIENLLTIQDNIPKQMCVGLPNSAKFKPMLESQTYNNKNNNKINYSSINDRQIKIEVRDNGNGIKDENLAFIFDDKHDQADENLDGVGLGLAICVQLCNQMNAFIMYRSTLQVGSEFALQIPLLVHEGPKLNRRLSLGSAAFGSDIIEENRVREDHICNEVQFAEDNPNILNKYEKLMVKQKIPYVTFLNGMECLMYIKRLNCKNCKSVLIFTDMNMPYMDGLKLAKNIRNTTTYKTYTIVLISAEEYDNKENIFDQVYYKPILPKKLVEIYNMTQEITDENKRIQNLKIKE